MNQINLTKLETPLGQMYACATEDGICLLEFSNRKNLEKEYKDLERLFNGIIIEGESKFFPELRKQLKEYFSGERKKFDIPLSFPGTEFQQKVWSELTNIPYSETRSYKQQAIAINNPKAVRGVAKANSMNRIAILIPCHRVIGSDGSLTGYAAGLDKKKWLLEFEQKNN